MVYNGEGEPKVENPKEGDIYIGVFDGLDGKGAGSRLYRYIGGEWKELMSSVIANQVNITSMEQLKIFRDNVTGGKDYKGMEVHLKTDLDFSPDASTFAFYLMGAAEEWTPIGTSETPFRGTFDGEGHTIKNFTVTTSEAGARIGFFGYVENATIEHLHFVNAEVTASGEGTFGAIVVGQVQNDLTVKDVTVTGSTVTAQESAKVGSLVGSSAGTVKVEEVEVEVTDPANRDSGKEGTVLVGSGEVTFQGKNEIEYPLADGFIERHYKNGDETTVICEISSPEGLKAFRDSVNGEGEFVGKADNYENKTVKLMTDINLNNENWTPIGTDANSFDGTFDGCGKPIANLKIDTDDSSSYKWGFFSVLKGTVKDVVFEDIDISAQNASGVGAVAAKCENATISNVKVHIKEGGSIEGFQWVGGLVGYATSLTANGNEVSGSIKYLSYKAGGLVGLVLQKNNKFENNILRNLTISTSGGWDYMGGLIGGTSNANEGVTMNNNTFENVTLDGSATGLTNGGDIGALMGNVGNGPYYSKDNVGTVTVIAKSGTNIHHKGLWGRDPADLENSSNPNLTVMWNGVAVTEKSYALASLENLEMFRDWVNSGNTFEGETIVLTKDIDLSSVENWMPIGGSKHSETKVYENPFSGTFVGGSVGADGTVTEELRTISHMTIALTAEHDIGFAAFFNFVQNASIGYLRFVDANVTNLFKDGDSYAAQNAVLVGLATQNLTIEHVEIGTYEEWQQGNKAPYVTSGKVASAFVARTNYKQNTFAKIEIDNCVNYADICAPKATAYIAQAEGGQVGDNDTSFTIKNSNNYGNLSMPQNEADVAASNDNRDIVMGAYVGYNQNAKPIVLINCENFGNITAICNYFVTKINIGGLISSVRGSTGSMLVDCINRGNITVDMKDTTVTREFEIGGLTGSGGATMYHVEQLGDITVTSVCNAKITVGGVSGNEDKGNLYMKNRSEYNELPATTRDTSGEKYNRYEGTGTSPKPSECSNIVYCDITVTCPESVTVQLGALTGNGHANDTIDSTFVSVYATSNGTNLHSKVDSLPLNGMTGAGSYKITNSVLHFAAIKDRGFDTVVSWNEDGE